MTKKRTKNVEMSLNINKIPHKPPNDDKDKKQTNSQTQKSKTTKTRFKANTKRDKVNKKKPETSAKR